VGDIVIGLIGGVIGGWLMGPLGIRSSQMVADVVVAFVGGVIPYSWPGHFDAPEQQAIMRQTR